MYKKGDKVIAIYTPTLIEKEFIVGGVYTIINYSEGFVSIKNKNDKPLFYWYDERIFTPIKEYRNLTINNILYE